MAKGGGVMHGKWGHAWQGACVLGGHAWWVGVHGRGACMAGGVCGVGVHVWQEIRPLKRTVRILLECILVLNNV